MKTYLNKTLYKYILIILGVLFLVVFIWFRFIRERLPKEIPFNLSLLGFFILLNLCGIYLYIILSLLKEPKPLNPIIKQILDLIYIPLETLDHSIKNSLNKHYKRSIIFLASNLNYFIVHTTLFYYAFEMFPRILLVIVLFIDIFGYHELYFIYKFIILGVLILLGKYIKYSLKYAKEHFIESLANKLNIIMSYEYAIQIIEDKPPEDDNEEDYIPETMVVPLAIFVDFQTTTFIEQVIYYPYTTVQTRYDDSYYTKRNLPQPKKYSPTEIDTRVENILKISLLLASYDLTHNYNSKVKILRILIFMNYFICWLYILIMSFPSLFYASFWELWILFSIQNVYEPFSGNLIFDI